MSVEKAIRESWGSYKPLTDLVPLDELVTGWMPKAEEEERLNPPFKPFVSMLRQATPTTGTTSSGTTLETVLETLMVWSDSLGAAKQIADAIKGRFHRADFDWSQGRVLCMSESNRRETHEPDGVWSIALDYLVRISQTGAG